MSAIFKIQSSSGQYEVQLGVGISKNVIKENSFIIVDELVEKLWTKSIPEKTYSVLAIEKNKTLQTCAQIIEAMRLQGMQRTSNLIAFGGGIIQDLATFTASIYMRGVNWTYYPTTLLGMVDSCLGGKSSINVGRYKNIAGNYYPPRKIIIDVEFCKTLSLPEQVSGLCEAVKICFAAKTDSFDRYANEFFNSLLPFPSDELLSLVELTLRTKKTFIEEDEFDLGPRLLLNFGHTFGHAIEAATQFSIAHGVAVGIGMLAEIRLGMLLNNWHHLPERALKLDSYVRNLLATIPSMVGTIRNLDVDLAMDAFKSDKKHSQKSYVVVACNQAGFLERVSIPLGKEADQMILEIFEWMKKEFSHEV